MHMEDIIVNKILFAHSHFVIPVKDLAEIYGIRKEVIEDIINKDSNMFPMDFVVELPARNDGKTEGGEELALTDMGVGILGAFLRSDKIADQNVIILRILRRIRELVELYYGELVMKIEEIEKKLNGDQNLDLHN